MASNKNFLLGFGERLTAPMEPPPLMVEKDLPYTIGESKTRLAPQASVLVDTLARIPNLARPNDHVVAVMTLHPAFLAKSYYPGSLMDTFHLNPVGSKVREITPEKWTFKKHPDSIFTTEIIVEASRKQFSDFSNQLTQIEASSPEGKDLIKIENLRAYSVEEKVKPMTRHGNSILYEIVLHSNVLPQSNYILEGFVKYTESLGLKLDIDTRLYAKGLCFLSLNSPSDSVNRVAEYQFLRAIREMPRLQPIESIFRSVTNFPITLPDADALDKGLRVAVFDGGMKKGTPLDRWVNVLEAPNLGKEHQFAIRHGSCVTSALLFGSLKNGQPLERPYAIVDHYRVVDEDDINGNSDPDIHKVLNRIVSILKSTKYEYVNFSIGPDLPIEDNDVNPWTAVLDDIFSNGATFVTSAVGNSGTQNWDTGNARIQPPSDGVNIFSIGASNSQNDKWERANYSSVGPGRSPGVIKPDVVGFGGLQPTEPFYFIDINNYKTSFEWHGTSFASPAVLRTALAIRAHFGAVLSPLALKALLVHTAENNNISKREVGWGRVQSDIEKIVLTDDSTVRVLFQGMLSPADWVKCPIPMPFDDLVGKVLVAATICFGSAVDPQDPMNYTRSGLEIRFRPHEGKRNEKQKYARTQPFFQSKIMYPNKDGLRHDAHVWETTMSAGRIFLAKSLKNPTLNIHYNARDGGDTTKTAEPIPYSLVITVSAPKVNNLYNKVVARYRNTLEILQPVISVPIRV